LSEDALLSAPRRFGKGPPPRYRKQHLQKRFLAGHTGDKIWDYHQGLVIKPLTLIAEGLRDAVPTRRTSSRHDENAEMFAEMWEKSRKGKIRQ